IRQKYSILRRSEDQRRSGSELLPHRQDGAQSSAFLLFPKPKRFWELDLSRALPSPTAKGIRRQWSSKPQISNQRHGGERKRWTRRPGWRREWWRWRRQFRICNRPASYGHIQTSRTRHGKKQRRGKWRRAVRSY